jgi:nucleoside 2-deoxyribosyltransferase
MNDMKNIIYLSGPITDPQTGLPRDGWQQVFNEAKKTIETMGFETISPVDIALNAEADWSGLGMSGNAQVFGAPDGSHTWPMEVPRWFYLQQCIRSLTQHLLWGRGVSTDSSRHRLLGLYVIGDKDGILKSNGTKCEINFAIAAGLPVWAQFLDGQQIDDQLNPVTDGKTLSEAANELR